MFPALITLAIFPFVSSWGDFLWALLITDKPDLYTLPLGVATLESAFSQDWRLVAAGSVISTLPILLLFIWTQKYIIPAMWAQASKAKLPAEDIVANPPSLSNPKLKKI